MDVIAAVDVGTTGAKAALLDRDGSIVASAYASYPTRSQGNQIEQEPSDWWAATVTGLKSLWGQAPDVRTVAVAMSGQMQDVILVSEEDSLAPAILYSDTRGQTEIQSVHERLGDARLRAVTGNLQDASSLLAKLLWLKRRRPDLYNQARTLFVGAHDYVAWRLCRRRPEPRPELVEGPVEGSRVTDYTTASTTGLLDLSANVWAVELLGALKLRTDWLPQLVAADAQVGEVGEAIARETGLPEGIPVFHGAGDVATTTLGAGAGEPGRYYAYLGTSGWLAATELQSPVDPLTGIFNLRHPDPERLILVGPMLMAAGNFEWLREQFGNLELNATGKPEATAYDVLNALASTAPPGSNGVLYLPYLAGERAPFRDANARGVFFGLTHRTTRQDLYRAVMEGVAFSMRAIRDVMPGSTLRAGDPELSMVGGGARSPRWAQIFADVFNCRVRVLAAPGDVGVRGAALIAGKALGWYASYVPGPDFFPIQATFLPEPATAGRYDRLFEVFRNLYPALRSNFAYLARALEEGA
jgi:xylulokinase